MHPWRGHNRYREVAILFHRIPTLEYHRYLATRQLNHVRVCHSARINQSPRFNRPTCAAIRRLSNCEVPSIGTGALRATAAVSMTSDIPTKSRSGLAQQQLCLLVGRDKSMLNVVARTKPLREGLVGGEGPSLVPRLGPIMRDCKGSLSRCSVPADSVR